MADKSGFLGMRDISDASYKYSPEKVRLIDEKLERLQAEMSGKIIVFDDDPTGGQTLHGMAEYTRWTDTVLDEAFKDKRKMFFILTDSRRMQQEKAGCLLREITGNVIKAARKAGGGTGLHIICRSDSTLRGHYPAETEALAEALREGTGSAPDGEILIPFFEEGGRYTIDDVQYLNDGNGRLIPVGKSEFASDRTFGYSNSNLKMWIEEKTKGGCPAAGVRPVSLSMLRDLDSEAITGMLSKMRDMSRIIVNATCYDDLKVFCISYLEAVSMGKRFICRTAASWPKVLAGIRGSIFPARDEILGGSRTGRGGLIVAGSHVGRTTAQLDCLRNGLGGINGGAGFIEFDQHLAMPHLAIRHTVRDVAQDLVQDTAQDSARDTACDVTHDTARDAVRDIARDAVRHMVLSDAVLSDEKLNCEITRVASEASALIKNGRTAIVYTKRTRVDAGGSGSSEDNLTLTNRIADAVTQVVMKITERPAYIIAKGGSTSSDIAVKALGVVKAEILGQAYPGVPIWCLGPESRYPGISYVIFPGNVGNPETLKDIVEMLTDSSSLSSCMSSSPSSSS